MENLKEMIDVNTIVGDPVETPDGGVILTVSKVGFGFAMGGSEFSAESSGSYTDEGEDGANHPFGGGSGGGVSITPIAFLVVNSKGVNMLRLEENTHLFEKMIDIAPTAIDKIQAMMNNKQSTKKNKRMSAKEKTNDDYDDHHDNHLI